jgi:hypothetical protein
MLRESKSKNKLISSQASTQIAQTDKKNHPKQIQDLFANERPN